MQTDFRKRDEIRRANAKRRKKGEEELPVPEYYPVITLVLYFSDRRWSGSRNIKDYLNIPEGLEHVLIVKRFLEEAHGDDN